MSVQEDTLQGLQEALSYAQGNLQLKTTVVEVSDEEISFNNQKTQAHQKIIDKQGCW